MDITRRAMFYSGLIMPGLGQWVLGQRKKGALIMVGVLALLFILFIRIELLFYHGFFPSGIFDFDHLELSPTMIRDLNHQAYVQNWWLLVLIIALWLGSVWDAWRTGKAMEKP